MMADPYQMNNLLVKTLDITHAPNTPFLNRPLNKVVARLNALLLALKFCIGIEFTDPWLQPHSQGNEKSLRDALNSRYDGVYASQPKVMFSACKLYYLVEQKSSEANKV
jgi:N-acetylglucosamine-6-sulfatase